MMNHFFLMMLDLMFIVVASYILSNAIEYLGEKLSLSQGATGSVIAAVSTALPEAIIPFIAFFGFSVHDHSVSEIGIGTVLGAPLMLSSLSLSIIGLLISFRRGLKSTFNINVDNLRFDLNVFFISYIIILFGLQLYQFVITKYLISISLILIYIYYVYIKFHNSNNEIKEGFSVISDNKLFFRIKNIYIILLQLLIGLIFLIISARLFIQSLSIVANSLEVSPYLLSLIIIPIATEFPEKFNSILWMYKGKDTMAISNIFGAMIFQGTIIPALVMLHLNMLNKHSHVVTMLLTILSVLWIYLNILCKKRLEVWMFIITIVFYIVNIGASIIWR